MSAYEKETSKLGILSENGEHEQKNNKTKPKKKKKEEGASKIN